MALRWTPTPYRRDRSDEIADVDGKGRYRVRRIKLRSGFSQFVALLNGEQIGTASMFDGAKVIAEEHAGDTGPLAKATAP